MGQFSSRPVIFDPSKMASWDIEETSAANGEFSKSEVFTQEKENFVAFYHKSQNLICVYCCSAEQWHYDESFTFNIKIISDPDQIIIFQTTATFSKKHPYCSVLLTESIPEKLLIQINLCSNYPYTRKDRYLGIRNSGSTCYMASILQVLFHTTAFRTLIYSFKNPPPSVSTLQKLFMELQLSSRAPSPDSFIRALGSVQELAAVQHDAHEFFIALFERLETDLGDKFKEAEADFFGGKTTRTIEAPSIDYKVSNEENFITMPVVVDGLKSLQESLSLMTASEHLSDEYDAGEKGKAPAEQRLFFSKLPPILTFQLCRFKFNPKTNSVIEIKTNFDCPFDLDMKDFSIENINCETKYELYGITAHSGNPVFGHYTSFLRPGLGQQWVQFNDGSTKLVDLQQVSRLFGASSQNQPSFFRAFSFSSAVAYMLFYIRKDKLDYIHSNDSIPLHLAPHRSNLFFSRFKFYENIKGSPVSNIEPAYEWQNPKDTIRDLLTRLKPEKDLSLYSAWAQMPGKAEFIGPLSLDLYASTFVIKGHATTFFILPHELDNYPVFLTTAKPPRGYIGVSTPSNILSLVPKGFSPKYQMRPIQPGKPTFNTPPVIQLLQPGSCILAQPETKVVLHIANKRYIFPSSATYSDVQKRISMEKNDSPSSIIFLNQSTPLKPKNYPFVSQFPSTYLNYQILKPGVTACSISLFSPFHFIVNKYGTKLGVTKTPEWVKKGTNVNQIIDLVPTIFPNNSAKFIYKYVVVSRGSLERCKETLKLSDTPQNESLRVDFVFNEAPTTRDNFRSMIKRQSPMSIEVRYAMNEYLESFENASQFCTITSTTTGKQLLETMHHASSSQDQLHSPDYTNLQIIVFINEKIKIRQTLESLDSLIYPVIIDVVGKMTKPNQRICIAILAPHQLKQSIPIPRSLSGVLNPSNKISE